MTMKPEITTTKADYPATTPWGEPYDVLVAADGLACYSTPSHGGIYLSPEKRAEMPASLRDVKTWAGEGWYEEDCDWALVVLSFPELYDFRAFTDAAKMVSSRQPEVYAQYKLEAMGKGKVA